MGPLFECSGLPEQPRFCIHMPSSCQIWEPQAGLRRGKLWFEIHRLQLSGPFLLKTTVTSADCEAPGFFLALLGELWVTPLDCLVILEEARYKLQLASLQRI